MNEIPLEFWKRVAMKLRDERGWEMTPTQMEDLGNNILDKLRVGLKKRGYEVPDDDRELLDWLKESYKNREKE